MSAVLPIALASLAAPKQMLTVPCVQVWGSGMKAVNGLYKQAPLEGYIGPLAFNKPGTALWLYRWHQTWWHLSKLHQPLDSERDFTDPVIYTAMVRGPQRDVPPISGWTGDVMTGYGPAPAPTLSRLGVCSVDTHDNGSLSWLGTAATDASLLYVEEKEHDARGEKMRDEAHHEHHHWHEDVDRVHLMWGPAAFTAFEALFILSILLLLARVLCCDRLHTRPSRRADTRIIFCPETGIPELHEAEVQTAQPLMAKV